MESIIEALGAYRNMVYAVKIYEEGHRCGYVQVPHVLVKRTGGWAIDSLAVHGGVTFTLREIKAGDDFLPPGWWVGFDCAHAGDKWDREAAEKYFGRERAAKHAAFALWNVGELRSREYVIDQCKYLIDQLRELDV